MKGIINFALFLLMTTVIFSCKEKAASAADATQDAATSEGIVYTVAPEDAKINWEGSKPGTTHYGTIDIQSGQATVKDNQVVAGSFVIDMNTIVSNDLEGDYKGYLESHLKGLGDDDKADDFFNVNKFPTATFDIVSIAPSTEENVNAMVTGNLTIKGISKEITFPANITVTEDNVAVTTNKFSINRTDWGIVYNSKNFIKDIGDKFVEDNIDLQLMINAKAKTM